uniref:C-type lectin domain-containing protein n=1 Tax=Panagrolaimus sp. ES5 TaxID=591445 RepID=A0AC34GU90_9BILA
MQLLFLIVGIYLFAAGECLDRPKCWTCQPSQCIKKETGPNWVPFGDNLYALLEEQVFQQEDNSAWIGRNKIDKPGVNGTYTWTDGSATDDWPVPWDKRQPNEPWTDCIFMANRADNFGEWSDYFCDQNVPPYYTPNPPFAICKKSKPAE